MKFFTIIVLAFTCSISAFAQDSLEEGNTFTVYVEGPSIIKYRVITNTWSDGCNGMGTEIETTVLSKSGAKTAVIDINVMTYQTLMECEGAKPEKVVLESEWMELKVKTANKVIFLVGSNQTVEVQ